MHTGWWPGALSPHVLTNIIRYIVQLEPTFVTMHNAMLWTWLWLLRHCKYNRDFLAITMLIIPVQCYKYIHGPLTITIGNDNCNSQCWKHKRQSLPLFECCNCEFTLRIHDVVARSICNVVRPAIRKICVMEWLANTMLQLHRWSFYHNVAQWRQPSELKGQNIRLERATFKRLS